MTSLSLPPAGKPDGVLLSRGKTAANPHGLWGDSKGNLYTAGNLDGVTKYVKL